MRFPILAEMQHVGQLFIDGQKIDSVIGLSNLGKFVRLVKAVSPSSCTFVQLTTSPRQCQ